MDRDSRIVLFPDAIVAKKGSKFTMLLLSLGLMVLGFTPSKTSLEEQLQPLGYWNSGQYLEVDQADGDPMLALFENGLDVYQIQSDGPMVRLGRLHLGYQKPSDVQALPQSAAILTDRALVLVDLTDPSRPQIASQLPAEASAMAVQGTSLFLLGETTYAVDIADIHQPQITHQFDLGYSPKAGYLLDQFLITLERAYGARVFAIDSENQKLQPAGPPNGNLIGRPIVDAILVGKYLYIAANEIYGFEITEEGNLNLHTTLATDLAIRDLEIFGERLIWSGSDGDFNGLEFAQLDPSFLLHGPAIRLNKGEFDNILAVNSAMFFAVSPQTGIHQFRPETSFSNVDTVAHRKSALAMAFDAPLAYVALQNQLQVISFEDPTSPVIVATYAGLPAKVQKMVQADGWLHLAGENDYRRYRIAADGSLTLESMVQLPEVGFTQTILALQVIDEAVWIGKTKILVRLDQSDHQAPSIAKVFEFLSSNDQMVIHPPYVTAATRTRLRGYSIQPDSLKTLLSRSLNRVEGSLNYPLTLNQRLVIAGNQVFDYRRPGFVRPLDLGPFLFKDTISEDDFISGIGETGFQIWDFADPEAPVLLVERPQLTGERLLQNADQLLTFQSEPTVLTLLPKPDLNGTAILPWMVDNVEFKSQVGFFNGSGREATLQLNATDRNGVTVTQTLQLPPNSSRTYDASQLFPGRSGYSLSIRGPRSVWITYVNINVASQSGGSSPSQTTALRVEELSDQIAFNITGPPATAAITLVSPDEGESIPVDLSLANGQGVVAQSLLTLKSRQPMPILISDLFPQPFGDSGVIIAKSQNGARLAGTAFTFNQNRQPAMSQPFTVKEEALSPVRFTHVTDYGEYNDYLTMSMVNGRLVQTGKKGVIIRDTNNPEIPVLEIKPDREARDATLVGNTLLVLTFDQLEIRNANTGALLKVIPLESQYHKMTASGGMLFLYSLSSNSTPVFDLEDPRNPLPLLELSTKFNSPVHILYFEEHAYIGTTDGLWVFQRTPNGFDFLGTILQGFEVYGVFQNDNTLLLATDYFSTENLVQEFHPNPGQLPTAGLVHEMEGRLVSVHNGRGLFLDGFTDRRPKLVDLSDFSVLGKWPLAIGDDARIWGNYAWFNNYFDRLSLLDITDPAQPELVAEFYARTHLGGLAQTPSRIYALEAAFNGQGRLHILEDKVNPSNVGEYDFGLETPVSIEVRDGLAFIADSAKGLVVVDLEGSEPRIVAQAGTSAWYLALNGPFAITGNNDNLVEIFDIRDPFSPIQLGSYGGYYGPTGLAPDGNLVLATSVSFGLHIIDISNPQRPEKIGELGTSANNRDEHTYDVAIRDNYAYLAEHHGLAIVDFSDPNNPQLIGRVLPRQRFNQIALQDHLLFATGTQDLTVFDISVAHMPRRIGAWEGSSYQLVVRDNCLWQTGASPSEKLEWRQQAAVLPWTVQSDRFRSQIQLANLAEHPEEVRLNAVDIDGQAQVQTVVLSPNSVQTLSPVDLFPQLGSTAITVETPSNKIAASFNTFSLNADGTLGAPAQAGGLPSANLRDGLAFSFPNPIETAALVIAAPFNHGPKTIHLDLFGPSGWVARAQLTVQDQRPIGKTLNDLFAGVDLPVSMTVTAQSEDGTRLTGTTFIFNQRQQPATSEAFNRSAVFLPR